MKKTHSGGDRNGPGKNELDKQSNNTPAISCKVAAAAIASLAGLERLRYSYDVWKALGCPGDMPQPGISMDYDIIVIVLVGLYRGQRIDAGAGWAIGFLTYSIDADHMAWGAILGALLGWLVGHWRERLFLEQLLHRWLVFTFGFIGYKLFHYILISGGPPATESGKYRVCGRVSVTGAGLTGDLVAHARGPCSNSRAIRFQGRAPHCEERPENTWNT